MLDYGRYRYNMFANSDPWYPGALAIEKTLRKMDASRFPPGIDVKALLREAHDGLYQSDKPESGH